MMHNVHFISTPIYVYILVALFRNATPVFRVYKYYIIAHVITNVASEGYVTFFWLPTTYLPYDVYVTNGWLFQWGVSGFLQFYILAQFIVVIGASVLEMFHYRFKVVVINNTEKFAMKMPTSLLNIFRVFIVFHLSVIIYTSIDNQTTVYQQYKKAALFKKEPGLPEQLKCHTIFILAPEDPIQMGMIGSWGIGTLVGSVIIVSTVLFINQFLNQAKNLSKATKKLQKTLITSLLIQGMIHGVMIIFPICMQIYQMIFTFSNNDIATGLLFCIAYHGLFSTCAMIVFTKQLRPKLPKFLKCRSGPGVVSVRSL